LNLADTPSPPYYVVIFTSLRQPGDDAAYAAMAEKMRQLAAEQEGFLGMESARNDVGITVSYWKDPAAIRAWKNHVEHVAARRLGREKWYSRFIVRVARVEKEYRFDRSDEAM